MPKENPGYYTTSEEVLELLVSWVDARPDTVVQTSAEM